MHRDPKSMRAQGKLHAIGLTVMLCMAANTYITNFTFRSDVQAAANGTQNTTLIGYLAANCSNGSSLTPVTRMFDSSTNSSYTNGSLETDSAESPYGYSSFELTCGTPLA